jgi:membrane-associated phospholipid phosphatase
MPLLRDVVLPGLGAVAVVAVTGRAVRLLGGDDPPEDRAVRALQRAFDHEPRSGEAAVATKPADPPGPREPIDMVTAPLSWYSGVPQTIASGAVWCGVTWLSTRDRRSAIAPAAALALETACFVASAALVGRPRPAGVWRPEQPHATSSFPSGHTAAAFALHGTLADLLDRHGAPYARFLGPLLRYGVPAAIAFSRVYRGQHHISDTVAGLVLGRWSAALVRRQLVSARPPVSARLSRGSPDAHLSQSRRAVERIPWLR